MYASTTGVLGILSKRKAALAFGAAALILVLIISGCSSKAAPGPRLEGAWARATAAAAAADAGNGPSEHSDHTGGGDNMMVSAVYGILHAGSKADALIGIKTAAAESASLHQSTVKDEIMRMEPVARLELPSGTQVELQPGGYHIMLMGLRHALAPDDRFSLTLVFEHAGEVPVSVTVRES